MPSTEKKWLNIPEKTTFSVYFKRNIEYFKFSKIHYVSLWVCALGGGLAYFAFNIARGVNRELVPEASVKDSSTKISRKRLFFKTNSKESQSKAKKAVTLNAREVRFIKFASVEYNRQLYMTPRDFLDAMIVQEPRPRLTRRILSQKDLEKLRKAALDLKKNSAKSKKNNRMFHTLHDNGIVSYTEYLFLLSFLTKPQADCQIAFKMIDRDENSYVDRQEFLDLETIFSGVWKAKRGISEEKKRRTSRKSKADQQRTSRKTKSDQQRTSISRFYVDDETGLQRRHRVETTLLTYFFGEDGKGLLSFEAFDEFMLNLRIEVLDDEFQEFAKGRETITEVDFIKSLIRYTFQDPDNDNVFVRRVIEGLSEEKGITFEDFHKFCRFLNHLNDFAMASKFSRLIYKRLSEDVFHRLVEICGGREVNPYVIHVVFLAFDLKGKKNMNHAEFVSVMRHRQKRLYKFNTGISFKKAFKRCMREEIRKSSVKLRVA